MSNVRLVFYSLVQALATSFVCGVAVALMEKLQDWEAPNNGYLDTVALLLLFINAALVSATLVLAYPAFLLLQMRLREGFVLLLSTIVWLILILGTILAVIVFTDIHVHMPF